MKKISSALFTYFSLLTMLVGFFLPNYTYIVNAMEGDLDTGSEIPFTNVDNGVIYLDMEENNTKVITLDSSFGSFETCSGGNLTTISFEDGKCSITANKYGKSYVTFSYVVNGDVVPRDVIYVVDVQFDQYQEYILNKLPNEYEITYDYNQDDLEEQINKILPNDFTVSFEDDRNYDDWGVNICTNYVENQNLCHGKLIYQYNNYPNETSEIEAEFEVLIKDDVINEHHYDPKLHYIPTQYISAGEIKELDIQGITYDNSNNYFWISSDNNIAKMNEKNQLVGVTGGVTSIKMVDKKTFDYVEFDVRVSAFNVKRPLDDLKNLFSGTVEIDVSNFSSLDNSSSVALSYFNKLGENVEGINGLWAYNATCVDGLSGCVIDYYYYDNYHNYISDQTPVFDIVFRGLKASSVSSYYSVNDKYYVHLNKANSFTLFNYENSIPNVVYDESYLSLVAEENGVYSFTPIKEGTTKIDFFVDDYMTSVNLEVLFEENDIIEFKGFYDNLKEINVPFSMEDANINLIKNYVEAYIKDSLRDNDVAKFIKINAVEVKDKDIELSMYVDYEGKRLFDYYFYTKFVNLKYNLVSDENTYKALETLKETIKDEYTASLNGSIYLANEYTGDDFYNNLINQVPLMHDANSSNGLFNVRVVYGGTYKYNTHLLGGVYYDIYIYKDEVLVGVDRTYINTNFLIDRSVHDSDEQVTGIAYITNVIKDITGEEYVVENVVDNYYRVSGKNTFNIIYDHKDLIAAEDAQIYLDGDGLISLDVGEEYQLEVLYNPPTANYANASFYSSDSNVFTVNNEGKITAQGKGYAILSFSDGSDLEYYLVTVGYEGKEFINHLIGELNMGLLRIEFSEVAEWEYEDDFLANRIRDLFYKKYDSDYSGAYSFDISVVKDNGSYKYIACVYGICSDKQEFEYEYYGLSAGPEKMELSVGESAESYVDYTEGELSDLRYTIIDKNIATVSKDGVVTALKEGRTYLKIYDKRHEYVYHIPIEVDIDVYINKMIDEVKDKTYDINYIIKEDEYTFARSIGYAVFPKLVADGYDFDSAIFGDEYSNQISYSYDEESKKLTITYSLDDKEYDITTNINMGGVALEDIMYEVGWGETIFPSYFTSDGGVPTAKSSDDEVCKVVLDEYNNSPWIEGVAPGFCEVTYSYQGFDTVVDVVVDVDSIIGMALEGIDFEEDEINISLDQYDISNRTDYSYNSIYDAAVYNYYRKKIYYNGYLDVSVTQVGASENGDEFTISYRYDNYDIGYGVHYESEEHVVKINYTGHTEGWEDLADELKATVKKKYTLTNDQMMQYMLSTDRYRSLYMYSDFLDDVEDVCEDCTVVQFGWGSTDGNLGVIKEGFEYVIFKGDEPIYKSYVDLVGSFVMDVGDLEDHHEFEKQLKINIHESYKKNKDKGKIPNINIFLQSSAKEYEFEYPVELKYVYSSGEAMSYDVTIDGHEFNAIISVNFVEGGETPEEPPKDEEKEETIVKVEKITLNKDILNLEVGKTFKLTATVSPDNATNKKVKWSSSNEKVVKVVDGLVTAVGAGSAVITVTSEDGGAKTTLNVSVIKPGLAGDIDGDGKINIKDLVMLRKHLAEITVLKGDSLKAADFNKDGNVNIKDLVNMRKHLAN